MLRFEAVGFAFNGFVLDRKGCRLLHDGRELAIEPRTFDLLSYLIEHQDRVVPKQELLEKVWDVQVLSDGVLSNTVAKLRRVLGQRPEDREPIETVHGRGYRFRAPPARERAPDAPQPTPQPSTSSEARRDPFVGRDDLMGVLQARLLARAPGSENLVILSGEAGIGKTRTARELARGARGRGLRVWTGAAHEAEGAPPYWPWIQVLRAAHDELGDAAFRACMPDAAWPLAQLLPELAGAAPAPALEPQAARFRLFEALSSFLTKAASERPLLIVLDDLHCADLGTIELLGDAARALQEQPVTFLTTLRSGEPPDPAHGQAPLARLSRLAAVVELAGLSAQAVAELTAALTGSARAELASALHDRTQGNPLFVRQSLDLMLQRGDLSLEQELVAGAELPPAIRHIVRRRVQGLPQPTRHVVGAAAVAGKYFDAALLADVLQMDPAELLDRLEPALRLGVVDARGHALQPGVGAWPQLPDAFAFAHVLVRDSLYEELSLRERGELHARVASALARRHGHDSRHLAAIAHHLLRALPLDLPAAMTACRRAAAAARETSSFDAAAQLLSAAVAKLDQHGGDPETRFWLLLELGADHFYAGLIASAWRTFREAAEQARAGARLDLLAEIAPRLVDCLELGLGDPVFARAVVEQALARGEPRAPAVQASLLAQRAELAIELSAGERAELLHEAARLAEQSGAPDAILEVAHTRAILRDPTCLADNAAAAEQFLILMERYAEVAAGVRYRSLRRFGAQLTRYLCALTACDLAAADAALEQCGQIADGSHARAAQLAVRLSRAGRALGDGRLSDLRQLIPAAQPRPGAELPLEREVWLAYRAALSEAQGSLPETEELQPDGGSVAQPLAARFAPYAIIARARWASLRGDLERVRVLLALIPSALLGRMPVQHGDLGALCSLAEIRLAQGDLTAARALYERLSPHAGLNAVGPCFEYRGAVAHFLGLLARALGDADAARRHFLQALALNRSLGMAAQVACAERELGALNAEPAHAGE